MQAKSAIILILALFVVKYAIISNCKCSFLHTLIFSIIKIRIKIYDETNKNPPFNSKSNDGLE